MRLRPSRGTHLVLRAETLPGLRVVVYAPIPGTFNRFVLVLPQPDGTIYVGLTDEPADGPVPDVPAADRARDRLPPRRGLGGVRAPASTAPTWSAPSPGSGRCSTSRGDGETADISRRHAVLTSRTGVVTIVGGKLTTYRRMAEDAVDAALAHAGLDAGPCRTARRCRCSARPTGSTLAGLEQPARLVRRFGTDAGLVLDTARAATGLSDDELLAPIADGVPVTLAELVFGVTHEGAADVDDLLDRRTRIGLVPPTGPSPYPPPSGRCPAPALNTFDFCSRPMQSPN